MAEIAGTPCPTCRAAVDGRPFCPRDGTIVADRFVLGDRYLVATLIGAGTSAFVYSARDPHSRKPLAIKVPKPHHLTVPDRAARFLHQAQAASVLDHEHLVRILDYGDDHLVGSPYLVMERLSGQPLAAVLETSQVMDPSRALRILGQLARGLASVHAAELVHADLNPRNVMIVQTSGRELVKLCDVGLPRFAERNELGVLFGTTAYLAPEQLRDDGDGPAVDLYALGVIAFELLTGRRPHDAATPAALVERKLADDANLAVPASLIKHAVPAPIIELIEQCLALDPARRPSTADEAAARIERVVRGTTASAPTPAPPPNPARLIGDRIGGYVITELIDIGGLGAVYAAEHELLGTKAAIKVLMPEVSSVPGMAERFLFEARSSGQIQSPHVPRYFDFGSLPSGQPYAVMELFRGMTVGQRLRVDGPFAIDDAARLLAQVASVLELAHEAGIIHRDIKPDNLFLATGDDGRDVVKVLDFGVAKAVVPNTETKTAAGVILGTPHYCAPEQVVGADVGPAADVYGLGATAFKMLTGKPPFDGDTMEVLRAKMVREPPLADSVRPDLPQAVSATLSRMLAREVADRLASMRDVLDELATWHGRVARPPSQPRAATAPASGSTARPATFATLATLKPADPPPVPVPARLSSGRRWSLIGVALGASVVMGLVLSSSATSGRPPRPDPAREGGMVTPSGDPGAPRAGAAAGAGRATQVDAASSPDPALAITKTIPDVVAPDAAVPPIVVVDQAKRPGRAAPVTPKPRRPEAAPTTIRTSPRPDRPRAPLPEARSPNNPVIVNPWE